MNIPIDVFQLYFIEINCPNPENTESETDILLEITILANRAADSMYVQQHRS